MSEKSKKKTAPPRTKGRRVEQELPVRLTDKELLNVADIVAKLDQDIRSLRVSKKTRVEELTGEIKAKEAELAKCTNMIRTRTEVRQVACEEELVPRDGLVVTRRLDTKQIVGSRAMTQNERQPSLFGIDGGKTEVVLTKEAGDRLRASSKKNKGKKSAAAEASAAAPA